MELTEILIMITTVAGSTGLWRLIETKIKAKKEIKQFELTNNDGMQYRDDLKDRVRNLESLLAGSADEKELLRQQVLALTAEVHALRVKVEFLERENDRLKNM